MGSGTYMHYIEVGKWYIYAFPCIFINKTLKKGQEEMEFPTSLCVCQDQGRGEECGVCVHSGSGISLCALFNVASTDTLFT